MPTSSMFASGNGIVTTDFSSTQDRINSITVQPDGKILAVGYSDNRNSTGYIPPADYRDVIALARYNSDGSLDTSFDSDGKVTTSISLYYDVGGDVYVQADGKILVTSQASTLINLLRYNSNGTLDSTFDLDGIVSNSVLGLGAFNGRPTVIQQADGKILLSGPGGASSGGGLARYNTNGSLDTTFGNNGVVSAPSDIQVYDVTLQADGNILLSGSVGFGENQDTALIRYNPNGSADKSFGANGIAITDFAIYDYGYSVAVQADGKILVCGGTNSGIASSSFILARYNGNGSLDTSFDHDGKVTTSFGGTYDYGTSVAIQKDGKILVSGYSGAGAFNALALARYNSDGSLDASFDGDGKVTTPVYASVVNDAKATVALQSDGKILVSGYSHFGTTDDFVLVRYNADGSLDTGKFAGTAGNDLIIGGKGTIDGAAGVDTVKYSFNYNGISHAANGSYSVSTDSLVNIERLQFADKAIALDLTPDDHAGKALEFIGMLAFNAVTDKAIVGEIISYFDQMPSMHDICQLAINAGLTKALAGGDSSNTALTQLVFRNVVGHEASAGDVDFLVSYMDGRNDHMSQADFLTAIAGFQLNQNHVDLMGLQTTGVEYTAYHP